MKKVGIVSCDKWISKLEEDNNLKKALIDLGIDTKIISWQKPLKENFDLLVLRSVWGYQNHYKEFKEWLAYIKEKNIPLENNVDIITNNIKKDIQFSILEKNNIEFIKTSFIRQNEMSNKKIFSIIKNSDCVIKPSISGSGENTFKINTHNNKNNINTIKKENIIKTYKSILENNEDCKIMIQPFIPEIYNGEYSCVFINGELTHTMLRFPNVFHEKKRPYLINDVPESILKLARKVEKIPEYKDYLYMRVDMVLINGQAKVMEIELAEPDLLTKYIDDKNKKHDIIKTFAKKIERRVR